MGPASSTLHRSEDGGLSADTVLMFLGCAVLTATAAYGLTALSSLATLRGAWPVLAVAAVAAWGGLWAAWRRRRLQQPSKVDLGEVSSLPSGDSP